MGLVAAGEGQVRVRGAEGLVKRLTHGVEVDQRDIVFSGNLANRFGVIAQAVRDLARVVESLPVHGRDHHRRRAVLPRVGHEPLEVGLVTGERADSLACLLLVVVPHLNQNVVAGLDDAEEFRPPVLAQEPAQRLARFAVIGDGDLRLEKVGQHLSPTVERFARLVGGRRIAGDVDGGDVAGLPNLHRAHRGVRVGELESEAVVPSPGFGSLFAILQAHLAAARNLRPAHVDQE